MDKRLKILIAYDGSDCANAALNDLQRAGLPHKADAMVVSVAEAWLPPHCICRSARPQPHRSFSARQRVGDGWSSTLFG